MYRYIITHTRIKVKKKQKGLFFALEQIYTLTLFCQEVVLFPSFCATINIEQMERSTYMNAQSILNTVLSWVATTAVKLLLALAILLISFKIIGFIARKIEKSTEKHTADKTVTHTLAYVFKIGAKIIVVICLVGFVGIDVSGITALIASLGVGIGLAVNGALSNLAGGVLIILTRPFRIDDFIEAEGYAGTVEDIHITNTRLRTPDNKIVYIPNGSLSNDTIVNYSLQKTRRVDATFSISYTSDFKKAQQIITEICASHPMILKEPPPFVRISEHAASAILLTARVWTRNEDYWTVKFDLLESVKERFDAEGIKIPFPQLDIHMKNG